MSLVLGLENIGKGAATTITLDKTTLFALSAVAADSYFSDSQNVQVVSVVIKSPTTTQKKTLKFNLSNLAPEQNPSVTVIFSARARNDFSVIQIVLTDYDGDTLIVKGLDLPYIAPILQTSPTPPPPAVPTSLSTSASPNTLTEGDLFTATATVLDNYGQPSAGVSVTVTYDTSYVLTTDNLGVASVQLTALSAFPSVSFSATSGAFSASDSKALSITVPTYTPQTVTFGTGSNLLNSSTRAGFLNRTYPRHRTMITLSERTAISKLKFKIKISLQTGESYTGKVYGGLYFDDAGSLGNLILKTEEKDPNLLPTSTSGLTPTTFNLPHTVFLNPGVYWIVLESSPDYACFISGTESYQAGITHYAYTTNTDGQTHTSLIYVPSEPLSNKPDHPIGSTWWMSIQEFSLYYNGSQTISNSQGFFDGYEKLVVV